MDLCAIRHPPPCPSISGCYSENGLLTAAPIWKILGAILCALMVMAFLDDVPDLPGVLDQKCFLSAFRGTAHTDEKTGLRGRDAIFCLATSAAIVLVLLTASRQVSKPFIVCNRLVLSGASDPSPPPSEL